MSMRPLYLPLLLQKIAYSLANRALGRLACGLLSATGVPATKGRHLLQGTAIALPREEVNPESRLVFR